MATNLDSEAILLYQKVSAFVDDYGKNVPEDQQSALELAADLKDEFFHFVDKVNLKLMDDVDNFYGYFLFQMGKEIRFDLASPTGVNFKKAKYVIYFNPLIFLALTPQQMESTIKHEILHVVSLHLMRAKDFQGMYSKLALNLAMDIVVNTYLQPLPPDAASLERVNLQYSLYLLPFETFEYYAEEIQKALDERYKKSDRVDFSSRSQEFFKTEFDPLVTHDLWEESDELDEQTMSRFTEKYIDTAHKGKAANYLESMIEALKNSIHELPWNLYLKKMMGTVACEQRKTTTRRNRRQPERLDLPGRLRNYRAKIFIALDISGSISDDEFKQAMKEVLQIVQVYRHDITIIECDDEIRRTYSVKSFRDIKERLEIRGGTKFTPVFEYANSRKIDLLLYFTDGRGEDYLQVTPKGYKILWVISGDGDALSLKESYGIVKKLNPLKPPDTTLDSYDVEKGGFSMNNQEGMALDFNVQ